MVIKIQEFKLLYKRELKINKMFQYLMMKIMRVYQIKI